MAKIRTRKIQERDYGIVVRTKDGTRTFFSPSDYAIGTLMLQSKNQLDRRLRDSAKRDGLDLARVVRAFEKGVEQKERSRNIFEYSGRNSLRNVRRYARTYVGRVRSKSKDKFYEAKIEVPEADDRGGQHSVRDGRLRVYRKGPALH